MNYPGPLFDPLQNEIWRPIEGYEGHYEVSSLGRVSSIKREFISKANKLEHRKPIVLKPSIKKHGYLEVILCKENKTKSFKVAQLVIEAFWKKKPFEKAQINHINGKKEDNCIENLEWVTMSENQRHAFDTGLHNKTITSVICNETCRKYKSISDAARSIGGTPDGICHVLSGRQKHHRGYSFRFSNKSASSL